jgi:hypothetical protein
MHTALCVLAVLASVLLLRRLVLHRLVLHRRWHRQGRGGWLQRLARRLQASPEQQQQLTAAFEDLQRAMQPLRQEWLHARADLAQALGGEHLDPELMRTSFDRQDAALHALRHGIQGTLERLHTTLDARQRTLLAGMLTHRHRHAAC